MYIINKRQFHYLSHIIVMIEKLKTGITPDVLMPNILAV